MSFTKDGEIVTQRKDGAEEYHCNCAWFAAEADRHFQEVQRLRAAILGVVDALQAEQSLRVDYEKLPAIIALRNAVRGDAAPDEQDDNRCPSEIARGTQCARDKGHGSNHAHGSIVWTDTEANPPAPAPTTLSDALDALVREASHVALDAHSFGSSDSSPLAAARSRIEELFDNQRWAAIDNAYWFEQTNARRIELESEVARLRGLSEALRAESIRRGKELWELEAAATKTLGLEWDDFRNIYWLPADPGPIECATIAEAVGRAVNLRDLDADAELARLREDALRLERERDAAEKALAEQGSRGEWWSVPSEATHYVKVAVSDIVWKYAHSRRTLLERVLIDVAEKFKVGLDAARISTPESPK